MADLITTTNSGKKGSTKKCNKHSTRVDLTPMVDLGFLLITFFIFTTSISLPKALFLPLPADNKEEPPKAPQEKTLQLVLEQGNSIRYYSGDDSTNAAYTNYSATGLRQVIREKMAQVAARYHHASEMIVLIKPSSGAVYGNVVDVLDEMMINDVKRYMLLD